MTTGRRIPRPRFVAIIALVLAVVFSTAQAQSDRTPAVTLRLIRPDRQAAELLRLFEGSIAKSPAEILARWKSVSSNPNALGKPLEAAIAMFNHEMAPEWRVLSDTLIRIDPTTIPTGWSATIPADDGTVAAAVTAMRLSNDEDPPLLLAGRRLPVAQLARGGPAVACQLDQTILVASSRNDLAHAMAALATSRDRADGRSGRNPIRNNGYTQTGNPLFSVPIDSGIEFQIDPAQLHPAATASVAMRRSLVVLRALAGGGVTSSATLAHGTLGAIVRAARAGALHDDTVTANPVSIKREWLSLIPVTNLIAYASIAIDTTEQARAAAFAVADQVDRADPAHTRVAASRTRLNLLAAAFGLRPEIDLWPHLQGVSAAISADPRDLGAISGGWLILHFDHPETTAQLLNDSVPRIAAGLLGGKVKTRAPRGEGGSRASPGNDIQQPMVLGAFTGMPIHAWQADRNLVIAWGISALDSSRSITENPNRSAAALSESWRDTGKPAPSRVGALWPGRLWIPPRVWLDQPATLALVDLPPILWTGWNDRASTTDLFTWSGLEAATRRVVAALPLGPSDPR